MKGTPVDRCGWEQLLEGHFRGLRSLPIGADHPTGRLAQVRLGAVDVISMTGNAQRVSRNVFAVRQAPVDYAKITLMTRGGARFSQGGIDLDVGPGQFAVYAASRPYQLDLPHERWSCVVVTAPLAMLGLPAGILGQATMRVHDTSGAGRALRAVLDEVGQIGTTSLSARNRLGIAVTALLTATLVDGDVPATYPPDRALRYAVLDSIKARLSDPTLSTSELARAHHISTRTLQRLFEHEPRGIVGMIRDLRLEAVRQALADPAMRGYSVADVASRWCLSDPAWVSRSFRARYGASPSRYRCAALAESSEVHR